MLPLLLEETYDLKYSYYMKIILLFMLISIPKAYSIELVLNGVTYDIKEYKISNNGQKIVINNEQKRPKRVIRSRNSYKSPPNHFQSLISDLRERRGTTKDNFK
jgi:hypothetical protein